MNISESLRNDRTVLLWRQGRRREAIRLWWRASVNGLALGMGILMAAELGRWLARRS